MWLLRAPNLTWRQASFLAVLITNLTMIVVLLLQRDHPSLLLHESSKRILQQVSSGALDTTATSGSLFTGERVRDFGENRMLFGDEDGLTRKATSARPRPIGEGDCDKWSVTTTIFEPSNAVRRQAQLYKHGWCMVIVSDKKGQPTYDIKGIPEEGRRRVIYLNVQDQLAFADQTQIDMIRDLPWNHFGRKNVGFLYAIAHGAKWIWDFDDDNELTGQGDIVIPGLKGSEVTFLEANRSGIPAFNPYPLMGATHFPVWPRGLPLTRVKDEQCYKFKKEELIKTSAPISSFGIIQSLANHDPDVDGIHRLIMPLHFDFQPGPQSSRTNTLPVAVPQDSFAPLNAQAALFLESALWMTFLPVTVHGRVTDIWRGYVAERLGREIGKRVLFTPPLVRQDRNPHNFLADMQGESDLYLRSDALLQVLSGTSFRSSTLMGRIEELWVELHDRGFVEEEDVLLIQGWMRALLKLGYRFPDLGRR